MKKRRKSRKSLLAKIGKKIGIPITREGKVKDPSKKIQGTINQKTSPFNILKNKLYKAFPMLQIFDKNIKRIKNPTGYVEHKLSPITLLSKAYDWVKKNERIEKARRLAEEKVARRVERELVRAQKIWEKGAEEARKATEKLYKKIMADERVKQILKKKQFVKFRKIVTESAKRGREVAKDIKVSLSKETHELRLARDRAKQAYVGHKYPTKDFRKRRMEDIETAFAQRSFTKLEFLRRIGYTERIIKNRAVDITNTEIPREPSSIGDAFLIAIQEIIDEEQSTTYRSILQYRFNQWIKDGAQGSFIDRISPSEFTKGQSYFNFDAFIQKVKQIEKNFKGVSASERSASAQKIKKEELESELTDLLEDVSVLL